MNPLLVIDVAEEPISLDLAWVQVAIDPEGSPPASAHDAWLEAVGIPAAREIAEEFTGRALGVKTYRMTLAAFEDEIELPMPPLVSVDLIEYTDADGDTQSLGTGDFEIDETGILPKLVPVVSWPATDGSLNAVRITFTVGYAADSVPRAALAGMLLILGHLFKNREAVTDRQAFELPVGIEWTLRPMRIRLGMA